MPKSRKNRDPLIDEFSSRETVEYVYDYLKKHLPWRETEIGKCVTHQDLCELFDFELSRELHHLIPTVDEILQGSIHTPPRTPIRDVRYKWFVDDVQILLTEEQLRSALEAAYDSQDYYWVNKVVIKR